MLQISDGNETIEFDSHNYVLLENWLHDFPQSVFELKNWTIGELVNLKNEMYGELNEIIRIFKLALYLQHSEKILQIQEILIEKFNAMSPNELNISEQELTELKKNNPWINDLHTYL